MSAHEAYDFRDLSITANQLGNRRWQVRPRQRPYGLRSHASGGAVDRAS
jgi:hypothetical protein